jgi:hypothetical protein
MAKEYKEYYKISSPTDLCDISNFTKEVRIGKVFILQIDL